MHDFTCFNPTRIVLGKQSIAKLARLIPAGARVLVRAAVDDARSCASHHAL